MLGPVRRSGQLTITSGQVSRAGFEAQMKLLGEHYRTFGLSGSLPDDPETRPTEQAYAQAVLYRSCLGKAYNSDRLTQLYLELDGYSRKYERQYAVSERTRFRDERRALHRTGANRWS